MIVGRPEVPGTPLGHATNTIWIDGASSVSRVVYSADYRGTNTYDGQLLLWEVDEQGTKTVYTYDSLNQYFEKFARYSRWWAEQHHARGRVATPLDVLVRPPLRFLSMYVLRLGLLDGAHGLVLAVLAAMSVAAKYARLWAMGRGYSAVDR